MYYYLQLSEIPDLKSDYIYYPLHYQPEQTTSPEAGQYVHQSLIVNILSHGIGDDQLIYVKEHPAQFNWATFGELGRSKQFYDDLIELDNVKLVPVDYNHSKLLKNCHIVATATGTIGWEALLVNKFALIFGDPWYKKFNNAFKINTLHDLKSALDEISEFENNSNSPADIDNIMSRSYNNIADAISDYVT